MSETLEIVKKMKPCSFSYKDMPKEGKIQFDGKTHFGFVAQELNELFPKETFNVVHAEANGYLMVNSNEIVPLLVKCIQELNERIEKLEKGE